MKRANEHGGLSKEEYEDLQANDDEDGGSGGGGTFQKADARWGD